MTPIKKILYIIIFLLFSTSVFAANVYIDPDCGTPGDGSSPTCSGAGTDPHDSWDDVKSSIAGGNNYYQKCNTNDTVLSTSITLSEDDTVTLGAYYDAGTIGISGNRPIITLNNNNTDIIKIISSNDVTINNLDLRAGKDQIEVADNGVPGSDNLTIYNCLIGASVTDWGVRAIYSTARTGWEISYCTFDSASNTTDDAIALITTSNSSIHHNTFIDWGHTAVSVSGNSDSNLVYNNSFLETASGGSQAFEFYNETTTGNKFYNNYIKNSKNGSKLMGVSNEAYNNIFAFSPAVHAVNAYGNPLVMGSLSCCGSSYNCKCYNNTFYKADGPAIKVVNGAGAGSTDVTGLEITNNLIIEAGDCYSGSGTCSESNDHAILILDWNDNSDINTNTYVNNTIYTTGRTADIIRYLGDDKSVAEFNSEVNGVSGNVVTGNQSYSSQMEDPDNEDFDLVIGAESIDYASVTYAPATDKDGITRPQGSGDDVGALEYLLYISDPSPIADATDININIDPSWTNPTGENTNDGYFKVGACPTDAGDSVWTNEVHKTSHDPGKLAVDTLHCWKVDIDHDGGTETGTDREFRTAEGPPPQEEHLTKININSGGCEMIIDPGGCEIIVGQ